MLGRALRPAGAHDPAPNVPFMPSLPVLKPVGPPELSFVRSSMRRLAGTRTGCIHCRRSPLVGETVFFYGESMVCELCRPLRRDRPTRDEVVHSAEHELTVKRRFAA
jgi:hypothetical protein